jgi:transcription elongation factor GreA
MNGAQEPISPLDLEKLQRELAGLRSEREAVAATFRSDDSAGDMPDQADEERRATDAARLDSRIAEIEERIRRADVAPPPPADAVAVGSSVTVRAADGSERTLHIGDVADDFDPDLVTVDSPLGQALLGRRAGESVSYETPEGRTSVVVVST